MPHPYLARPFAIVAVALLVVACAGSTPSSPAPSATVPSGPIDATGDWRLATGTVDGADLPLDERWPVTLSIDGRQVGGTSACNQYGGEIVVEAGEVRFGQMGMNAMGCEEPVMAIEVAYHAALGRIRTASMDGDALLLGGDGVALRFERIPPVPIADLTETEWHLESILDGEVASSIVAGDQAPTLVMRGDGRLEGSTGCRGFGGRYVLAAGEVVVTELVTDDRGCLPPLDAQDLHVLSVLGAGFTASVDGDRLTLTSAGGWGLAYVAPGGD